MDSMVNRGIKVVAIIQARMGSTRLPGKVMMDLAAEPMLVRVVNRVLRANTLDETVVATTTNSADDCILSLCQQRGWAVFRGSEEDVLDRYYQAATVHNADAIVRIASDCPLIEPQIIDAIVVEYCRCYPGLDYVSNGIELSYPRGLDAGIMSARVLETAWREAGDKESREHVITYIRHHPGRFRIRNVSSDTDYSHMRWTVDTPEDLDFVRKIYGSFSDDTFTWREVIRLLRTHPEWLETNRHAGQKTVPP